jgi:hypothetical protein
MGKWEMVFWFMVGYFIVAVFSTAFLSRFVNKRMNKLYKKNKLERSKVFTWCFSILLSGTIVFLIFYCLPALLIKYHIGA